MRTDTASITANRQGLGQRMEFIFLCAFILCLPLMEAPKSIFLTLYALQWLANRRRERAFGGPWSIWDVSLLLLPLAAILSVVFSDVPEARYKDTGDVLAYAVLGLMIHRSRFDPRRLKVLSVVLLVSTLIALIHAGWAHFIALTREQIELHSVGHVNHSAIYLTLVALATLGTLVYYRPRNPAQILLLTAALAILGVALFYMQSRITAGLLIFCSILLVLAYPTRGLRYKGGFIALLALLLGISALIGNPAFDKFILVLQSEDIAFLNGREYLWPGALTVWLKHPVFGLGIDTWSTLQAEQVMAWAGQGYQLLPVDEFWELSHAHNLFLNTLAERGSVGFVALLLFLGLQAQLLWRYRPSPDTLPLENTLWAAAGGAWLVVVFGGLFNTTLHHEHGMLSMLLLCAFSGHVTDPAGQSELRLSTRHPEPGKDA